MKIGGISGVSSMGRTTRNTTVRRRPEGPVIQAPPQHSGGMQYEPKRQPVPRSYRKGVVA